MKNFIYTFIALLWSAGVFAQAPQSLKYQAIARDASGGVIASQTVGMQVSILQGSTSGTPVYIETFSPTTNQFGLINLDIGTGTVVSGDFSGIDWGSDSYFIKIEIDASGGTSYTEMGTSQLLSVPYALHAATAMAADLSTPFMLPQMTTVERDALSPMPGMLIFNTDVKNFQGYGEVSSSQLISQTDSTIGTCPSIVAGLWIVYQSFTAPSNTDLTEVVIAIQNDSPVPGRLEILSGDGTGGAVLYTQDITYPQCGDPGPCDFAIPLTTPFSLTTGNQYTLKFSATSGGLCCKRDLTNPYNGGIMYQNNTAQPGYDIYFILNAFDGSPIWGNLHE